VVEMKGARRRIAGGIDALARPQVFEAFQLANKVMALAGR
jgi:hypothetical protein